MRLIRHQLPKEVELLLAPMNKRLGIDDAGLSADLFILMRTKGQGIPTDARLQKMIQYLANRAKMPTIALSMLMKKRKMLLTQVVNNVYFRALWDRPDTVDALERFLVLFRSIALRSRETVCLACQYLNQCDFGRQYGRYVTDPSMIIDPDFSKQAHADCPALPAQSFTATISQGMSMFQQGLGNTGDEDEEHTQAPFAPLLKSDGVAGALTNAASGLSTPKADDEPEYLDVEDSGVENVSQAVDDNGAFILSNSVGGFSGDKIIKMCEDFGKSLSKEKLLLFEIGRKLSLTMSAQKKGKFKPVPNVDKDDKPEQMKSVQDMPNLVSSQHGLPDELFDAKLHKKELLKNQHMAPEDKIPLMYLLIDNSGSMTGQFRLNKNSILSRGSLCQVFSIALARRVFEDKGYLYCRFFAGSTTQLMRVRDANEFAAFERAIASQNFNGESTNIPGAIQTAIKDIKQAAQDKELASCEILMLTDCESQEFGYGTSLKTLLGAIPLNILDLSGSAASQTAGMKSTLEQVATKYFKAHQDAASLDKMVSLI